METRSSKWVRSNRRKTGERRRRRENFRYDVATTNFNIEFLMFLVLQYYTGPISEKKHSGIENFVEKCLFWKKKKITIFLVWIVCQNQLTIRAFDLHLPFWINQVSFYQMKVPFYISKQQFSGNILLQFFQ